MYTDAASEIIIISAIFSFVMLTMSVASYDGGFLKWSFSENTGRFLKLLLFRVLDVPTKILSYSLLWYTDSGQTAFVLVMVNLFIGIVVVVAVSKGYVDTLQNRIIDSFINHFRTDSRLKKMSVFTLRK